MSGARIRALVYMALSVALYFVGADLALVVGLLVVARIELIPSVRVTIDAPESVRSEWDKRWS